MLSLEKRNEVEVLVQSDGQNRESVAHESYVTLSSSENKKSNQPVFLLQIYLFSISTKSRNVAHAHCLGYKKMKMANFVLVVMEKYCFEGET